jgi:PAS domain S-box-containing protein
MNNLITNKNRRVLVIDDNRAIHDDFRKILCPECDTAALDATETLVFGPHTETVEYTQFEVDSAYQGEEGVLMVEKAIEAGRPYALAFVDVRMPPGFDGVETTHRIWNIDPDIQIVICTAFSDHSWDELFEKLGHLDKLLILKKPFDAVEASQMGHALMEKWWLLKQTRVKMDELECRWAIANKEILFQNEEKEKRAVEMRQALATLDATEDSVFISDPETLRLTYVNAGAIQQLGYTREELLGMTSFSFKPEFNEARYRELLAPMLRGEVRSHRCIMRHRHKDGHDLPVEVNLQYVAPAGESPRFIAIARDISERMREEENIRRMATVVRDSNDAITIQDFEGRITAWNRGAEMMYGYCEAEALQMNIERLTIPAKVSEQQDFNRRLIAGETVPSFETQRVTNDGRVLDVWMTVTKLTDEVGNPIGLASTERDITEQKMVENVLIENERNLKSIFAAVPVGMLLLDEDKIIISSNEAVSKLVSREYDQIIQFCCGNGLGCLHSIEDERGCGFSQSCADCQLRKGIDQVLQFNNSISDLEIKFPILIDGEEQNLWVSVCVEPVLINNCKHAIVTFQNISNRKKTEEALDESRNHLQSVTSNLPNVVLYQLVLDSKGFRQFSYINDAVYRINEVTVDEVMADSNVLYSQVMPEYLPGLLTAENEAVIKNSTFNYEFQCLLPSGKIRWFELLTSIRKQPDGYSISEGVQIDITDRKQAEVDKDKLEEQLQQAQKMESVGRLAGGVAHDFNNMLQVILGNTCLAIKKAPKGSSMLKNLMEINESANRSANLTRQLLAFARKQTIMPVVLDLNEVVTGILKMLKRLIGEDIDIEWIPGADIFPIKVDPSQIDQILANLCVNARDAIADIGKITIETGNRMFDIDYCNAHPDYIPGEYVFLSVSDNGCGMDHEILQHIFEPFFTTKDVGKGTGLGLSTVYGAIKQNNGFINVYSEMEIGTKFTFFLPRYAGKKLQTKTEDVETTMLCGQETVLVVEDESSILEMVIEMLQSSGYNTLAAGNPIEAIRLAEEYSDEINLVITDVVMPNMDGNNLSKHLLKLYPNLRCLFMSGYTSDVIANYGIMNKGVNFIHKPFSMIELTTKVRNVLS